LTELLSTAQKKVTGIDSVIQKVETELTQEVDAALFQVEKATCLGEDVDCVESSRTLYQVRQIRSKFNEIETVYRIRATIDMLNIIQ
jgi:hypothetical protein